MFNIGDKIVYPMHGAGVIESIEEKEILGNKQNYYIVRIPVGDMKVMIPTESIDDIGIREVIDEEKANEVLDVLRQRTACEAINWNKRYRENMLKIKSGDIFEVAEVVKSLMIRDKEKGLSTGEKKMLNNARQILISELVLVKNATPQEIENIIESNIGL